MTIRTTRFDPMEYLNDKDHLEFLNDALATGDSAVVVRAIGEIARARGMSALARDSGLGRSTLYKALGDDANPTIDTVMQVLKGLKLRLRAEAPENARDAA